MQIDKSTLVISKVLTFGLDPKSVALILNTQFQ